MNSGDYGIMVTTPSGEIAVIPVTPIDASGQYAVLAETADGSAVACRMCRTTNDVRAILAGTVNDSAVAVSTCGEEEPPIGNCCVQSDCTTFAVMRTFYGVAWETGVMCDGVGSLQDTCPGDGGANWPYPCVVADFADVLYPVFQLHIEKQDGSKSWDTPQMIFCTTAPEGQPVDPIYRFDAIGYDADLNIAYRVRLNCWIAFRYDISWPYYDGLYRVKWWANEVIIYEDYAGDFDGDGCPLLNDFPDYSAPLDATQFVDAHSTSFALDSTLHGYVGTLYILTEWLPTIRPATDADCTADCGAG